MSKDEQIETLLTKGVETILPSPDFLKKELYSGKRLTIYNGIDPTGPTLHIGHVIQLRKLRQFQDLGHKIIFLIGDFTARIGDPTDKMATRVQLSDKDVKKNLALYKKQAGKFIRFSGKNSAVVKFNNKWLGKLRFADVLELASHMTVDQMLKRDMFQKRTEEGKPIYIHEFMYPLMQGYDSVAMNVDGEIGGNDQLFNMLAGRTLLKKIKNKEKFVLTVKLLTDSSGEKMGKTTGNMISLLDTPFDIYGKVMSWSDSMMGVGFELCTDLTSSEAGLILKGNPRDSKMRLAFEITKSVHGEKLALNAQNSFIQTFQKKEVVLDNIPSSVSGRTYGEIIMEVLDTNSKGEARRLMENKAVSSVLTGVTIGPEKIDTPATPDVIKVGKKNFRKII